MDGYVFLDVEWADAKRHICSIAYQRTDRAGTLLDTSYQLVNPQCEFEPMLQNVHRITEEMVLGARRSISFGIGHWEVSFRQM